MALGRIETFSVTCIADGGDRFPRAMALGRIETFAGFGLHGCRLDSPERWLWGGLKQHGERQRVSLTGDSPERWLWGGLKQPRRDDSPVIH